MAILKRGGVRRSVEGGREIAEDLFGGGLALAENLVESFPHVYPLKEGLRIHR
jgi:hypothetical protein